MDAKDWTKIEELFHSALVLPPEARRAYLAEACSANPSWQVEVESLLAAHPQADQLGEFVSALAADWATKSHPLIGRTLGRYQIQSLLGVGGMGEVFLAEDTQLGRSAALKLLPAHFTNDAARVRRFEQEARAVLALNHPHIVTLFDLGQVDGVFFMATEYVEGETLRQRLKTQGALPVREALELTLQMAAALTAAHTAGIIHRDIKPENVMIRRDGYVKVLDFGLAKMAEPHPGLDSEEAQSLTEAGVVLGTARYMSPEQARGIHVDLRTDIFSLGVVLYEMLAGRAPFNGRTRGDLLVEILTAAPPPLVETAPATPAALETILHKALAKDPEARYPSVKEFAAVLKAIADEVAFSGRAAKALPLVSASPVTAPALPAKQGKTLRRIAVTGSLGLVALLGWYLFMQTRVSVESDILPQLKISHVTSWQTEPEQGDEVISLSPDGNLMAFGRAQNGQMDIFVQQLKGGEPRNITRDTWADYSPVWSSDGQQVAYCSLRDGKTEVWAMPYFGGTGRLVTTLDQQPSWLTRWSRDGARLYFERSKQLFVIELANSSVRQLTNFPPGKAGEEYFVISDDEQWLAYEAQVAGARHIFARPLTGGTPVQVTHESELNKGPLWLTSGQRLLYSSKRNGVMQICVGYLDGRRPLQLTFGYDNMVPWEVSNDGRKIFSRTYRKQASLHLVDLTASAERRFSTGVQPELFPQFAPNTNVLAYQQPVPNSPDVYHNTIFSRAQDGQSEALQLIADGYDPRWSPDGEKLAFLRKPEKSHQLWTVRKDGAAPQLVVEGLQPASYIQQPFGWTVAANFSWSPDGKALAFNATRAERVNLYAIAPDGTGETPLTYNNDPRIRYFSPLWSPDGKQLAFIGFNYNAGALPRALHITALPAQETSLQTLWQTKEQFRLLGWSADGTQLHVGVINAPRIADPVTVKLLAINTATGRTNPLAEMEHTYLHTVVPAPRGRKVVYVARRANADNVWLVSLDTGQHKQLTANTDPNVNLGGLAWTAQANLLGFVKQSTSTSIWLIENFK